MKLNWFSPLPPARTGIAEYTAQLLPALAARAEIVLWTEQTDWDAALERHAEVRHFEVGRLNWSELNRADATIYHMGNNPGFHYGIWLASRAHAGVVVLHDTRLQHFFAGVYRERWGDRAAYVAEMRRLYGQRGHRVAERFWTSTEGPEQIAESYPLTALALEHVLGAVVHTREAFELLKRERQWPVLYAPLPFAARPRKRLSGQSRPAARRTTAAESPYRLTLFGHISPNRRIDALMEALAGFEERERFRLDVYGEVWDVEHLRERIRRAGLEERVQLHGFVADAVLDEALERTHLAVNLRFPTMGESSLTQLRIWQHALPSLVTRTGWYGELPADAVLFVRPENEVEDIRQHLREFLRDPRRFARMGERGRRLLEEKHSIEAYAASVVGFLTRAESLRRRAAVERLTERVGAELGGWLSPKASKTSLRRIAEAILPLAGDESGFRAKEQSARAIRRQSVRVKGSA